MKTNFIKLCLLFVLCVFVAAHAVAQTPGIITKPANNGGQAVLNPNGDGYVSKTTAGFQGKNDEGAAYSEIPYRPFPAMGNEVIGDLNTGTIGGHTDFAPPQYAGATTSPAASYFDGTNMMFRMRLGSQSSASKGYSVLIDTDNTFNGGYPNPGFEYEVVLASNFAVQVIRHTATGSETIFSGATDSYSQISVAASTNSNNPDYFYDFYVPLTAFAGGITASTPLRMSAVTISSAQSGLLGTISDVAGVDDKLYGNDPFKAWLDIINAFPPTSMGEIQAGEFSKVTATPPVVNDPIYTTNTIITGTSVEAAGSLIIVYKNGVQMCGGAGQPTCPTVKTDGTWAMINIAPGTLSVNDVITATVSPTNKNTSGLSNKVIVLQGMCTTVDPPVITGIYNADGGIKGISGTSTYNGPQTINIFHSANNNIVYYSMLFTPQPGASYPYAWSLAFDTKDKALNAGLYTATITPQGGCESIRSNQICYKAGNSGTTNTQTPTITQVTLKDGTVINTGGATTYVPANIRSISGTLSSFTTGTTIEVLVDGVAQTDVTTIQAPNSTSPHRWTMDISKLVLSPGDLITVRSKILSSDCGSILSSASNYLIVTPVTAAPVINTGPYCGLVTSIKGTSTEQAGTVVEIYADGIATGKTGSVTITGNWSVDLSSLSGGGIAPGVKITARAKAVDKLLSPISNEVVSSPVPTGSVTINPVTEGQTTVTGTGPASTSSVLYYITVTVDGIPYPEVLTDAFGNWKVSNINYFDVYPGATVTASYRTSGFTCPSNPVSTTVLCRKPLKYNIGLSDITICSGETVEITLPYSETDVYYNIMNGGMPSGNYVIGTGGAIVLTSGALYGSTTLTVVGTKIGGSGCSETMEGNRKVTVNPLPDTSGLSFSPNSVSSDCPGIYSANLLGTLTTNSYQLVDASGNLVGTPVQGNGSSTVGIVLSTGYIMTTQTFTVRTTSSATNCSTNAAAPAFTVNINSPILTHAVSPSSATVCQNQTADIILDNSQTGYAYQIMRSSDNAPMSDAVAGTGAALTITTYVLTTIGTQEYYVAVRATPTNSCTNDFRLNSKFTIQVMGNATSESTASWSTKCGENLSVTLSGNTPPLGGAGEWSLTNRVNNNTAVISIASPNEASTTVSGLSSGTYTFTWKVTSSCGGTPTSSTSSVTVTVNCPAMYEIVPYKYIDEYSTGNILATAQDNDGGVKSTSLALGHLLPPGTALDLASGLITVADPGSLVAGVYTFNIDVLDNHGFTSTVPVTLRFYGTSSTVTPLSAELASFTASLRSGAAFLQWTTASEQGNSHFEVQRSTDGYTFSPIGKVAGRGNSMTTASYAFTDKQPLHRTAYYRLRQVDVNGQFTFSGTVSLLLNAANSLVVAPNPFEREVNLTLQTAPAETVQVTVYTVAGKEIYGSSFTSEGDVLTVRLDLGSLSKGLYLLKASSSRGQQIQRIVKR